MDAMIEEFLDEARSCLDTLDADIIAFEKNPNDRALIDRIFRAAHTIKGTSGFLNLARLQKTAHAAETLLGSYRDGSAAVSREGISNILAFFGRIRKLLAHVAEHGAEPEVDDDTEISSDAAARTVRLRVDILERLMTAAGDLVLARNGLSEAVGEKIVPEMPLLRLNSVISTLQQGLLDARMQPVSDAWGHLPRIVRDIAAELGKEIRLETEGGAAGIDRQLLESVRDPLTHLIRNAADHGIETAAERKKAGKPSCGLIHLSARHEGGNIVIRVTDDGGGIDTAKVAAKAVEKKLATADAVAGMEKTKLLQFIFAPAFTTSDSISTFSGRGVGLDVVKTNIERAGGSIAIETENGRGSVFILRIPLTLAIIPALIVDIGGGTYAIPQTAVREIVRLESSTDGVMRLRDRILPLVSVCELFGATRDGGFAVVIDAGGRYFAMDADRIRDSMEIVVKPFPLQTEFFSGATVMGDGTTAPILDMMAIAEYAGIAVSKDIETQEETENTDYILLFRGGGDVVSGVMLPLIDRLEEIDVDKIEMTSSGRTVRCRDRIIPLLPFSPQTNLRTAGKQPVIVFADGDRLCGVMVDAVTDIVSASVDIELYAGTDGVLGSALIDGRVVDMIDPGYFIGKTSRKVDAENKGRRVLLVDDSAFFRNMIEPTLTLAGFDVVTATDAEKALQLHMRGEKFDLIISDIEMPGMNGLEFASRIRADGSIWRKTPLLALSAHATAVDIRRGRAAGFDDYITKFDRESLIKSITTAGRAA